MKTICFYAEHTDKTLDLLNYVLDSFPCFARCETIEMNYLEISIMARFEDLAPIEKIFSEIV